MDKEEILNEVIGSFKMTVDTKGLKKLEKYIDNFEQENKSLKSNWKALKEWLIEQRKYDHEEDKYGDTLDKMNELESDKE